MSKWRIYYGNGHVVDGKNADDWREAPNHDVQVIVVEEPRPDPLPEDLRRHKGIVGCAKKHVTFYTGVDAYDPLGYGKLKLGSLLPREKYDAIWEWAYGDY